ncbi:MAG TPA: hypothetical protein VF719_07720 [Abditibacteriaceae bacterium]|jgi:hypothetical protein
MRLVHLTSLCALCTVSTLAPAGAQINPEDELIEDEPVPAVPAPPAQPAPTPPANAAPAPQTAPANTTSNPAATSNSSATNAPAANVSAANSPASGETVTVPRAVWEQLLRDVEELKASRTAAPSTPAAVAPVESVPVENAPVDNGSTEAAPEEVDVNRNYLKLPDISLVLQMKGALSSDKRDDERKKLGLAEGELAIQSYIYPGVKAEAYLVGAPGEGEPLGFEEGFLTFQGVAKGLNVNVGRKFTPFGRTGELHNHSWLYTRQLLPIRNLVSGEALVGDGVGLNYLLPLKGKTFVRASLGAWSGEGTEDTFNSSDPTDPFFGGVPAGSSAGFTRRFYTGRLWAGHPIGQNGELEFGVSRAQGRSSITDDTDATTDGSVTLNGLDASYRLFMNGNKRLLLRGEYFRYKPRGLFTSSATGYYGLANLRLNKYNDVGLLYESSGFPQAPGAREKAMSLIYTRQFTEQYYARLQATRGDRPGGNYHEIRLQLTAGLGPHTHTLE